MSEVVISVENLYKEYRLGTISHGTLHRDLQSWWANLRGKEDPNSLVSSSYSEKVNDTNKHFYALKDISFDVKQGEILGIIGSNGAGKSTLLKILSRVTAPTKGIVKVKGRIASLLEVGTGFHPELTGRENIYLNGTILGMNRKEIDAKFEEIVEFAEIEKFVDTPVKRYSSGMYVRLAFAVAAHLEPEILLVDEVLAVGDVAFQKKCLGKMSEVAEGGRTVLFVSHNMGAVKALCQRGILLQEGKVLINDSIGSVINYYIGYKKTCEFYKAPYKLQTPYFKEINLIQNSEHINGFAIDKPIRILFNIETYGKKGLSIGIVIKNSQDLWVIHSSDEFRNNTMYNNISQRECEIPAYALAAGNYVINVSLWQRNVEIFQSITDVLAFEIEFFGIVSDRTTSNEWKGICGPGLLKWY